MYVSIIKITDENRNYDEWQMAALNAPETYQGQKGWVSSIYFSDKDKSEYGLITVWESMKDINAFWDSRPPEIKEALSKPGVRNLYYVNNSF